MPKDIRFPDVSMYELIDYILESQRLDWSWRKLNVSLMAQIGCCQRDKWFQDDKDDSGKRIDWVLVWTEVNSKIKKVPEIIKQRRTRRWLPKCMSADLSWPKAWRPVMTVDRKQLQLMYCSRKLDCEQWRQRGRKNGKRTYTK